MIPWYYAVITFFVGGWLGILSMCLCFAAKEADRDQVEQSPRPYA